MLMIILQTAILLTLHCTNGLFLGIPCNRAISDISSWRRSSFLHSSNKHVETVDKEHSKQRIDKFLSGLSVGRSRSYFNALCERGLVKVNNKVVSKSYKISDGDIVEFVVEEAVTTDLNAEDIPLDILYEDKHIIAINKPQGMVVHPAPGSPNGTFVNALLHHLGSSAQPLLDSVRVPVEDVASDQREDGELVELPETPEAAAAVAACLRPGVVHRLDKGTSGVLIAGKNPEAVSRLSRLFSNRKIRKVYLTVCVGNPGEATITKPIGRHQKNRQLMATVEDPSRGKFAVSHVRTIAFDGKLSAALVRIETGRTHQIRVHLRERRTPIIGDTAYGNPDWNRRLEKTGEVQRPLLHAYLTEFVHPFTGEKVLLKAPIPADMKNILGKLEVPGITRKEINIVDHGSCLLAEHISTSFPCDKEDHPHASLETSYPLGVNGEGFVPEDRVSFEELPWTDQELPEVDWKEVDPITKRK